MTKKKSIKKDIEGLLALLPDLDEEQEKKVQEIRDLLSKIPDEEEKTRGSFADDRL